MIKSIIRNPEEFDYYCYNCKKSNHIHLSPEEANQVCAKYDNMLQKFTTDSECSPEPIEPSKS